MAISTLSGPSRRQPGWLAANVALRPSARSSRWSATVGSRARGPTPGRTMTSHGRSARSRLTSPNPRVSTAPDRRARSMPALKALPTSSARKIRPSVEPISSRSTDAGPTVGVVAEWARRIDRTRSQHFVRTSGIGGESTTALTVPIGPVNVVVSADKTSVQRWCLFDAHPSCSMMSWAASRVTGHWLALARDAVVAGSGCPRSAQ